MKKRIVIALLLCAIALTSVLAFTGCESYLNADTLKGYDVDLAKEVAKELGVEVKFYEIKDWDKKVILLKSGNIDLVWNGMTILDDLKAEMEISNPYMDNKQVCVVNKNNASKYNSIESLKDAKIAYEIGSSANEWVNDNGLGEKATGLQTQMMAMTDVLSGSSDVAIVDLLLANFYTTSNSSFSNLVQTITLSDETYGIGAKKGNVGLMDKICTAIMKLQENGTVNEIAKKYGIEDRLIDLNYTSKWDSLTDEEKAGWNKIQDKGYFIVGCTIYAPMSYTD